MSRWAGGRVGAGVRCVLAPNPGPATLEGTNTWVLSGPRDPAALVVDPGPLAESHLRAVVAAAHEDGLRIDTVVLTHSHADHAEGARRFAELTGAPVLCQDPDRTGFGQALGPGAAVTVGDLQVEVVPTPGHTGDSVSLWVPTWEVLLTGDTVLGRGTSVVAHPDGRLGDYLESLRRLERLVVDRRVRRLLPGHGPLLGHPDAPPVEVLRRCLDHRLARLEQVRAAVAAGAVGAAEVVAVVHAGLDDALRPLAEMSVQAQLHHLGLAES